MPHGDILNPSVRMRAKISEQWAASHALFAAEEQFGAEVLEP